MRICVASDLHGHFPEIPECDLFLISGDVCLQYVQPVNGPINIAQQARWLTLEFKPWLKSLKAKKIAMCWGNHDFVGEKRDMIPALPCEILQDNFIIFEGIKIYGLPWQLRFYDWAFNLDEPELAKKYSFVPDDTDIIVSHGPPLNYGDRLNPFRGKPGKNGGSPSFLETINKIKPALVVTGHIHPAHGIFHPNDKTIVANCSLVDSKYQLKNKPFVFDWDEENRVVKLVDKEEQ